MWIILVIRYSNFRSNSLVFFHYQKEKSVPKEHYFMKISECAMCLKTFFILFYYFSSTFVLPRVKTEIEKEEELANKITFSFLLRWLLACLQSNLKF